MAFQKTVKFKTPDGVEHDTAAAAKTYMFAANFGVLGAATREEFEEAAKGPSAITEVERLREALREVYLVAFPRANTGKPRAPREPKTPSTTAPVDPAPQSGESVGESATEPPDAGSQEPPAEDQPTSQNSRKGKR